MSTTPLCHRRCRKHPAEDANNASEDSHGRFRPFKLRSRTQVQPVNTDIWEAPTKTVQGDTVQTLLDLQTWSPSVIAAAVQFLVSATQPWILLLCMGCPHANSAATCALRDSPCRTLGKMCLCVGCLSACCWYTIITKWDSCVYQEKEV